MRDFERRHAIDHSHPDGASERFGKQRERATQTPPAMRGRNHAEPRIERERIAVTFARKQSGHFVAFLDQHDEHILLGFTVEVDVVAKKTLAQIAARTPPR